jgi:signal peptidase I
MTGGFSSDMPVRPLIADFFEDILNKGLSLRVRVTGRSMRPFLKGGEVVTIKSVKAGSLRLGDLIYFRDNFGSYILHRVIRKWRDKNGMPLVQTKGDAVFSIDHPVACDKVLGRVSCIEQARKSGRIRRIDMDAASSITFNYLFALFHLASANVRAAVSMLGTWHVARQ